MMQLNVRLTAQSGHAHALVEALHTRMRQTRREGGCTDAHVAADVGEANAFWYSEDWNDLNALEQEIRSDRFSQLLALVETSAQPPVLEFRVISEIRGLGYLTAVREAGKPRQAPSLPLPGISQHRPDHEVGRTPHGRATRQIHEGR